jgi:hypothetical protein
MAVSRDLAAAFLQVHFLNTHGGLTNAALDSACASRRTLRDSDRTTFGSLSHGGLTPAALG